MPPPKNTAWIEHVRAFRAAQPNPISYKEALIGAKGSYKRGQTGGAAQQNVSRPGFPGERHALLKVDGGLVKGNYIGPGTQVMKRLRRGDRPVSEVDRVAKAHDLRYAIAKNTKDTRAADKKMVASVKQIKREGTDSRFNTAQADLIRAKMGLEDLGLSHTAFATHGGVKEPRDRNLARSHLRSLERQGF